MSHTFFVSKWIYIELLRMQIFCENHENYDQVYLDMGKAIPNLVITIL